MSGWLLKVTRPFYPVLARDGFPALSALFVVGTVNGAALEFMPAPQQGPRGAGVEQRQCPQGAGPKVAGSLAAVAEKSC